MFSPVPISTVAEVVEKKEELVIKDPLALVSIMRLMKQEPTVMDVLDAVEMNELIVMTKEDVTAVREDVEIIIRDQPVVEQFTIVYQEHQEVKVVMVDWVKDIISPEPMDQEDLLDRLVDAQV